MDNIYEQLLLEKSREELINKSKSADRTKAYGTTRWERRSKQHIFTTIQNYNRIDFNALFKANILNFVVPIHGETNDYSVEVVFEGICDKLKRELKGNNQKLEYKIVYRAIIKAIKEADVLIFCTCPDFKYRQAYWATRGQYNASRPELRPSDITNPNDTKGAGCKHVMNVIGDLNWAVKLATSVNNYIFFMKDNFEDKFAEIIWPAISDTPYEEAYQTGLFDDLASTVGTLNSEGTGYSDEDTTEVDQANEYARTSREQEEPEDFDNDEEEEGPLFRSVGRGALDDYYIKQDHTREETAKRFNISTGELGKLLDEYGLKKREE